MRVLREVAPTGLPAVQESQARHDLEPDEILRDVRHVPHHYDVSASPMSYIFEQLGEGKVLQVLATRSVVVLPDKRVTGVVDSGLLSLSSASSWEKYPGELDL